MNIGKSITELAAEMDRRSALKHDVIKPAEKIHLLDTGELDVDGEVFNLQPHAHTQLATITEIRKPYYERCREASPELLAENVNFWMNRSGRSHMVRGMGDQARAIVSNRYLRIENEAVAQTVLNLLYDIPDAMPVAMDITDSRLYMKFIFAETEAEVKVGDPVRMGISISNSEIGMGQYIINPFVERLICLNGMRGTDDMGMTYARRHLGAKQGEGVMQVLSAETIQKNHDAILSATTDILTHVANPENIQHMMSGLKATTQGNVLAPTHIREGVEVLGKEYGLTSDERVQMMGNLIEDGDFSRWGVLNAATKLANDVGFDRAHDLEAVGGKILSLNPRDWDSKVETINAMKIAA